MNMGNFVSNNCYYLHLRRCVYRYNVENRAHKELKRQESSPVVAPKHEAGIIDYQKSMRENKSYLAEAENKNIKLNDRLKDVYVTSNDGIPRLQNEKKSDEKLLPMKRTSDYFELGYKESKIIPVGRVSLMQAMKFISDHDKNASIWTVEKIADDNKIKRDVAGDILKYFSTYDIYIPGKTDKKLIGEQHLKMLPTAKVETENKQ